MSEFFNNTYVIIGTSLSVIAVVLYFVLTMGLIPGLSVELDDSGRLDPAAAGPSAVQTGQVLARLNRLRSIEMDTDVFTTEEFAQLIDFGVQIQAQDIGRDNPFVPTTYTPSGQLIVPNNPTAGQSTQVDTRAPAPPEEPIDRAGSEDASSSGGSAGANPNPANRQIGG